VQCMLCGAETDALQLIESVFVVGVEGGDLSSDTLTVCVGECADRIRSASAVILQDKRFEGK
jgi:hypothetical protein